MAKPVKLKVGDRVRMVNWTFDGVHHDTVIRKVARLKKKEITPHLSYWIGRNPGDFYGAFSRHEFRKLPESQAA